MLELPFSGYFEPPFHVQIPGHPHDHQVRIWLPPSYHHSDDRFPVLWVMDNLLEHAVSALTASHFTEAPEVIVVAVGAPLGLPSGEYGARRVYDFMPARDLLTWDEPALESGVRLGGAAPFLAFLAGPLRERVDHAYRTSGDHALAGHSGGAMFALYSLFTAAEPFSKYLIGSPAYGIDVERLQVEHDAQLAGLQIRLFLAAGGAELVDPGGAAARIGSTTTSICERLVTRAYDGFDVHATIYAGCSHSGVMAPLFSDGVRWLWRDAVKATLIPTDRTAD